MWRLWAYSGPLNQWDLGFILRHGLEGYVMQNPDGWIIFPTMRDAVHYCRDNHLGHVEMEPNLWIGHRPEKGTL